LNLVMAAAAEKPFVIYVLLKLLITDIPDSYITLD